MNVVQGTLGYEEALASFCDSSLNLDFEHINKEFLPFLPAAPALVLDLGSGVGQNSNALASLGYEVIAVEPLQAFIEVAKSNFTNASINWLQDSLPSLTKLSAYENAFSFILIDGVWHHLHPEQRADAIGRLKSLLHKDGSCAISLRNGPAGAGKYVFPTSLAEISELANSVNLNCHATSQNQPSKFAHKKHVTWSRVVLTHG